MNNSDTKPLFLKAILKYSRRNVMCFFNPFSPLARSQNNTITTAAWFYAFSIPCRTISMNSSATSAADFRPSGLNHW